MDFLFCFRRNTRYKQDSPPASDQHQFRRISVLSLFTRRNSSDYNLSNTKSRGKLSENRHWGNVARRVNNNDNENDVVPSSDEVWASLLSMFPDICPDYVRKEYKELRKKYGPGFDEQHLMNAIAERGSYPKLPHPADLVPGSINESGGPKQLHAYQESAAKILRVDYPNVPPTYIRTVLQEKGTLYRAHLYLHDTETVYSHLTDCRPYQRLHQREYDPARMPPIDRLRLDKSCRDVLLKEVEVARERRTESIENNEASERLADQDSMECQCCYSDCPTNLMISCTGPEPHFFCPICVRTYAETKIGAMGFELKCMCTAGCDSGFSKRKLERVLGTILTDRLAEIQQQRDIRAAGIEGLEVCPFCDFKAIAPPVEEDRQFACHNPTCRKVSCRLCKRISHIPQRCEEVAKKERNSARRMIEEAMTSAVVRRCTCGAPIIKEDGCNKMRCPQCVRMFCYVCRMEISAYDHFRNGRGRKGCPLYDLYSEDPADVHEVEAMDARDKATQTALDANQELKREDIEFAGLELREHRSACEPDHSPVPDTNGHAAKKKKNDDVNNNNTTTTTTTTTNHPQRSARRNRRAHLQRYRPDPAAGTFEPPWFMTDSGLVLAHGPTTNLPESGPGSYLPPWRLARAPSCGPRGSFDSLRLPKGLPGRSGPGAASAGLSDKQTGTMEMPKGSGIRACD